MKEQEPIIPGLQEKRNEKNGFYVVRVHYTADTDKATQEWFKQTKKGMPQASWRKEYEIDFYALSGQRIWPEFDPQYHVIKPFEIPIEWIRGRGIDFGQYNPTCCLWNAIDYDGNIYVYKEYYQGGRITAATHATEIARMSYYTNELGEQVKEEYRAGTYIDPSTKAGTQSKEIDEAKNSVPYSIFEIFHDNGVDCFPANNDTRAGWDRVSDYLKLREYKEPDGTVTLKPKLFIFNTCVNLIREIPTYRYEEQGPQMALKKDPAEKQIKKSDHACDAERYFTVSRPPIPDRPERELTFIQKDLKKIFNQSKNVEVQAWGEWNST